MRFRGTRDFLAAHGRLLLLALGVQLLLALCLSRLSVLWVNRLDSGQWLSTKTTLERGLAGAHNFLRGGQSVSDQRLHLGAWFAYQEVIFREPLDPVEVTCTFVLHRKAHLTFVFNRTQAGFSGIRLSLDPQRPSMLFAASSLGEFVSRVPLTHPALEPQRSYRLATRFTTGAVAISLDGSALGSFPVVLRSPQQVGFRGGGRMAIVDDIVIRKRGGASDLAPVATMYESFDSSRALPALFVALGLVLLVDLVAALRWRHRRSPAPREALLAAVVGSATLAVLAALLLAFFTFAARRYPAADAAMRTGEQAWRVSEGEAVDAMVRERYAVPPPEGVARILFLGSSQTWGAGAARESETIAATLERLLNDGAPPGRRYQCINGGISSVTSGFLLDLYEREWSRLGAELVIVNLSHNDGDPSRFRENLRRIAQIARGSGSRVMFVLEANSGEERQAALDELETKHAAMREAAQLEGAALVDMHAYLLANQDRGFLFWDIVHLSSLGQHLAAERLYLEVSRLLGEAAPRATTRGRT